ncbi:MAG: AMP-binding protein, partial [bacterium]|nr:AMP-binding protein [bacterium]
MSKNITKNLISGSSKFDKEKNYWLDKFENHPEKSSFQYDITGNDMDDYSGAEIKFAISGDVFTKLSHLTNRSDNNLFIILTAGLTLLLSKYTGSSDIVLGTPIYKQDVEGDFLNTILPLRNPLTTDMTFKELLMQVKRILAEANEHSNYPMERLLYYLGLPKIESGYPLFETVIMLQNIHEREYIKHMNYNMEFRLLRTETQIEGVLEYNCRIYRKETAEMIASHFSNLLQNVLADLGAPLAQIHMLPQQERRQVLIELNDTDTPYPEEKVVHELFEEQVKRTPEARAVTAEDNHFFQTAELTYKQLNEKANQLARLLREKGVAADTIVALMVTPSLEMAVGILAIAKAGGAYLPITHDAPVERIEYLLAESNCKILLTQGYLDTAPEFSG